MIYRVNQGVTCPGVHLSQAEPNVVRSQTPICKICEPLTNQSRHTTMTGHDHVTHPPELKTAASNRRGDKMEAQASSTGRSEGSHGPLPKDQPQGLGAVAEELPREWTCNLGGELLFFC